MTLGEVISNYRKEHGDMSMREFSRRCGLSVTYISSLENNRTPRGKAPVPTIDTYNAIAKAMGMDADDLVRAVNDKIIVNSGGKKNPMETSEKEISPARQAWLDAVDGMTEERIMNLLKLVETAKDVVKE